MGRSLRIQFPNAFYHVMAHGDGNQWIYKNKCDIPHKPENKLFLLDKCYDLTPFYL